MVELLMFQSVEALDIVLDFVLDFILVFILDFVLDLVHCQLDSNT